MTKLPVSTLAVFALVLIAVIVAAQAPPQSSAPAAPRAFSPVTQPDAGEPESR